MEFTVWCAKCVDIDCTFWHTVVSRLMSVFSSVECCPLVAIWEHVFFFLTHKSTFNLSLHLEIAALLQITTTIPKPSMYTSCGVFCLFFCHKQSLFTKRNIKNKIVPNYCMSCWQFKLHAKKKKNMNKNTNVNRRCTKNDR